MSPKAINNCSVSFSTNRLWLISADWHTLRSDQIICFSWGKSTCKCQCRIFATQNSISNNNIWPFVYCRETHLSFKRFKSLPHWAFRENIFTRLPLCSPALFPNKLFFPLIFSPSCIFGWESTGALSHKMKLSTGLSESWGALIALPNDMLIR